MPNRLFVTEILSVGAVDAGDDPAAEIVFYKRKDSVTPDRGDDNDNQEIPMDALDLSTLDDEIREQVSKHVETLEERVAELEAQIAAEPDVVPDDDTDDDVLKNAPESVRELVAKLQADVDEKTEALDAELEKRRLEEAVAAAGEFEKLLGKPDEVGPVLRKVQDGLGDDWSTFEQWLRAAAQRLEMGDVTDEIGKEAEELTGDDPVAKRDAWVRAKAADDPDADVYELREKFWKLHPELRQRKEV